MQWLGPGGGSMEVMKAFDCGGDGAINAVMGAVWAVFAVVGGVEMIG